MSSRFNVKNIPFQKSSIGSCQQDYSLKSADKRFFSSFADPANGIIFLNQHYEELFYDQRSLLADPIQYVSIDFYDNRLSEHLMNILIQNGKIVLTIYWIRDIQGRPEVNVKEITHKLFPSATEVYDVVQKKIWLFFNRINRSLNIYTGDVTKPQYVTHLFQWSFYTPEELKVLAIIEQKFLKPDPNNLPRAVYKITNKFDNLHRFAVHVHGEPLVQSTHQQVQKTQQKIEEAPLSATALPPVSLEDVFTVHLLDIDRLYAPILTAKPSFLNPDIPGVFAVPEELRLLYDVLESFDLKQLPDSNKRVKGYENIQEGRWQGLPNAIQHSVTTPYKLFVSKGSVGVIKEDSLIPLGILNHVYELKNGKPFTFLTITPITTPQQIITDIVEKKEGYLRMEILPHEGLSPGSMAVLEIWPPYSCSPIHNHGHAYGLIKVLSGQIRVQNFRQLTFDDFNAKPYLENDYKEDQYTWLSEESYGIHRLINPYPECCLSLQSYYHYKNTTKTVEYFSFLEKEEKKLEKNVKSKQKALKENEEFEYFYTEYYPQNDWKNYLKGQTVRVGTEHEKSDKRFIARVIEHYGLGTAEKPDYRFESLALTLKKEYDTINDQIKGLIG